MRLDVDGHDLLSRREVPRLIAEQLSFFTLDGLSARPSRPFDPFATLLAMQAGGEKEVVSVDIGGDKVVAASYTLRDGRLTQTGESLVGHGAGGTGYVEVLEAVARRAQLESLTVGVSYAGLVDGTRPLTGPNLPAFLAALDDRHGGDFANLFSSVAVANDAEAGIMAGALEAAKRYPECRRVIYVINGSGLGGAVLRENLIYATEPGHIQVVPRLNPFQQRRPCGVLGATYVCLEAVAAAKAGVEDIWFQQLGERLDSRLIAARYQAGDPLASDLYDNSALVAAHVIKGMASAFELLDDVDQTIVVGHGGIFHVPGYGERVISILAGDLLRVPRMIFTKDFSANACLDGGAIAAAASTLQLRVAAT